MTVLVRWACGFYLCLASASAWSQQMMCPPGSVPIGGGNAGWVGCSPVPGSTVAPNPGPAWSTRWGAIATANGGIVGVAEHSSSRKKAEKAAMKQCKAKRGRDCSISLSFGNQCGALAWGDTALYSTASGERASAETLALQKCSEHTQSCKVFYSACSYPERIR
jgi:hypothetical protein